MKITEVVKKGYPYNLIWDAIGIDSLRPIDYIMSFSKEELLSIVDSMFEYKFVDDVKAKLAMELVYDVNSSMDEVYKVLRITSDEEFESLRNRVFNVIRQNYWAFRYPNIRDSLGKFETEEVISFGLSYNTLFSVVNSGIHSIGDFHYWHNTDKLGLSPDSLAELRSLFEKFGSSIPECLCTSAETVKDEKKEGSYSGESSYDDLVAAKRNSLSTHVLLRHINKRGISREDISLDDYRLPFSTRVVNILKHEGYKTVGSVFKDLSELSNIKRVGSSSLEDIYSGLEVLGFDTNMAMSKQGVSV